VSGFLKRLFCMHRGGVAFVRNIYGDEINRSGGKRSIWVCKRCGGFIFEPYLNEPPATPAPLEQSS